MFITHLARDDAVLGVPTVSMQFLPMIVLPGPTGVA